MRGIQIMKQISWNAVRSVTIVCDCTTHQGSSQSMLNEMFDTDKHYYSQFLEQL